MKWKIMEFNDIIVKNKIVHIAILIYLFTLDKDYFWVMTKSLAWEFSNVKYISYNFHKFKQKET